MNTRLGITHSWGKICFKSSRGENIFSRPELEAGPPYSVQTKMLGDSVVRKLVFFLLELDQGTWANCFSVFATLKRRCVFECDQNPGLIQSIVDIQFRARANRQTNECSC